MMADDEAARQKYWADRFDEAHAFMIKAMDYPVADCGERLLSLPDAAREAGVEAAFSEKPHARGLPRIYILREGLIGNFVAAAQRLNYRGWVLKVEDGFRTRDMQKYSGLMPSLFDLIFSKVVWELDGRTPEPDFLFRRLLTLVAQIPKTGTHMSGSAMDISVLDRATGAEIDRGGPYLDMTERTPMNSPFIGPEATRNRKEITSIMRESGFVEYPYEFWHYSSGDAYEQILRGDVRPARYGAVDFDAATGKVTPIEKPEQPLNSLEDIRAEIQSALERHCKKSASA
jgi:zinc D-Ala-D-Ala dipeptidase